MTSALYPMVNDYLGAAERLHRHLEREHWNGALLTGPDPGIRFNARVGRFVKSYLPFIRWRDELIYLQAQGYWILDNWLLFDATGDERFKQLALTTSQSVLDFQRPEGYWPYPNPEWKGRIATVEGCFGALGLLESYSRTQMPTLLEGALAWYGYMRLGIGFRSQRDPDQLAVNYFAHSSGDGGGVPNNSTLVLWLIARIYEVTQNEAYLELAEPMRRWLAEVQLETGELPYRLSSNPEAHQVHFLCQQYNAFEFMDLAHYYRITGDAAVLPMMERLARFLASGLTSSGSAQYDCSNDRTDVPYYTAAVGQALSQATDLGLGSYGNSVSHAYEYLLSQQQASGGFAYSRGSYGVFSDRRSYPRAQSMILHHLLLESRRPTARIA